MCSNYISYPSAAQVAIHRQNKAANLILADVLDQLRDRSAANVRLCAQNATTRWCPICETTHITGAWCCHHRLCPICQVRRSRHVASDALEAYDLMRDAGDLDNASTHLLTLTQRNVPLGQLSGEIDKLLEALKSLRYTNHARKYLAGSARNIEVTYNYDAKTWHPHIHIVIILRDGHPQMDRSDYWRGLWRTLMGLDYDPVVDVRPIVDDGAIYEVSKYVAKSMELLTRLPEDERVTVISELNVALKKRMLIVYTGVWRLARRVLNQRDNVDFVDYEQISNDDNGTCHLCGGSMYHAMMVWDGNDYVWTTPPELYTPPADGRAIFV